MVLFGALNIGSACNPIIATLENECGCTGSQQSICGNCVKPVQQGGQCTGECGAHPCAVGLFCDDSGTCISVSILPGFGIGTAAKCNAAQERAANLNTCGTGLYCRSQQCLFGNGFRDNSDHCSAYAQQGDACGSTDSSGLPCAECEPGTGCVNGVCAASCVGHGGGPADCANMCGGQIPVCLALGTDSNGDVETTDTSSGSCYRNCGSGVGAACGAATPCCDVGNACGANGQCCETPDTTVACNPGDCCGQDNGSPGYVCRPQSAPTGGGAGPNVCVPCEASNGADCTDKSQCCQAKGYRCLPPLEAAGQTTCQTCHETDTYCGGDSDCCSGKCTANKCAPQCNENAPCTVPGAKGPCAAGKMDCTTDPQHPTCKSSYTPTSDNNCNGKDEDCDGVIDNGYVPVACTTTPTGCQTGFEAPGMTKCEPGNSSVDHVVCVSTKTDYCDSCEQSGCGTCFGSSCTPGVTLCQPGYVCRMGQLQGCLPQGDTVGCWPITTCQPCPETYCWLPSQLKSGTANATCP